MLKKTLLAFSAVSLFFLVACAPKVQESNQEEVPQNQEITNNESSLTWNTCGELTEQKGFGQNAYLVRDVKKVGGFHTGTVGLEGFMSVCNGNFVGTQITFNFANLTVSDITDQGMNQKLVDHLKSDDFFSTETFPTGVFVSKLLTKNSDGYDVVGDLTIKGITNEITFPIKVTQEGNEYKISGNIDIDRTLRDIMYSSTKLVDTLKDKAIEDTIKTSFELTTSPAL